MHYYKKNLGDYFKKAGRLSMLQHGAYNLLMDAIYDREKFPTLDEAIDWVWASSKEEIEAIEFVLKKFFTLEDGVYIQSRIKEEIDRYHDVAQTNKRIARERETKRKGNSTKRERSVNEAPPNQEPLTINHKPKRTSENKFSDEDFTVAKWMFTQIKKIMPSKKEPDYNKWAEVIRLIRERDGRSHQQITAVFGWANQDDFWQSNILSPAKLREQFDRLELQSKKQKKESNPQSHASHQPWSPE